MSPSSKVEPSAAQIARFKSTARALECDEDKDRFEAALGKITSHKPAKNEPKPKKKVPRK